MVALENLEHLAQETMSQEHTARLDFDGGDVFLGGNGLDSARVGLIVDGCARGVGLHGIEQLDGDIGKLCRLNASGMENLGSEVAQLGSLLEVEMTYGSGLVYDAGVVVVHTVDVGPNLYLTSTNSSSDERSGVIAASALQVIDLAIDVAADEALGDVYLHLGAGCQII